MHWTIIGGGIQGTTIAIQLRELGLPKDQLSIIDPNSSLCEQFNDYSHRISMPYLRSPIVHHVHPNPFHLKQFAKTKQYTHASYGQYQRPQTEMFMHHIHDQVHNYDLNQSHIQGYVEHLARQNNLWQIKLSNDRVMQSDYVILAQGCNHKPYIPNIYKGLEDVCHIFSEQFEPTMYEHSSHVIGSGISAAHLTLKLINQSSDKMVHLWMNKDIDIQHFDADPGWLGPKNMNHFLNIESSEERMAIINQERHKGSMPRELYLRLKKHIQSGRLLIHKEEIISVENHQIITRDTQTPYDAIILATGFKSTLMQQPIIQSLINKEHAPLTSSGFPAINSELEWLPQLFVAGGLADLELGPFARNIMGGRDAAQRIKLAYQRLAREETRRHA